MLVEAVPIRRQETDLQNYDDPNADIDTGRCRFCKYTGPAGQSCVRCPILYSDRPFIYERSLFNNIRTGQSEQRKVTRRQNIIVTHVTNRDGTNGQDNRPIKLELLKIEPRRGRQELPEEHWNEVLCEVTLSHSTGYAEGTAELMMPVNNGYYVKAPLEGLQVYRKNSDGGFTEVPYEIGNLSYDVEGKYVGRCQLC